MNISLYIDWQARALAAYHQASALQDAATGSELVGRVHSLTGRAVEPQAVYVDDETHMASAVVDGVLFRLRRQELVLVRPCPCCGLGRYESMAIESAADLGFALGTWRPPCLNCRPEDPPGWLDREDS